MKKIILPATTLCLLLMTLTACNVVNYNDEYRLVSYLERLSFHATILEIHDTHVLVQTIEGMGFNHVTRVTFGTRELEDIGASFGDVVNVVFTGDILQTYPEQVFATSWSLVSRHGDGIEPIPHVGAAHETNRIVSAMPLPRSYMPLRSIQIGADHGGFGYGAYTLTIHYDFSGDTIDYIPGEAFEQIAASLFDFIENLEAVTFSLVGTEETDTDNYIVRWSISRTSSNAGGGAITSFRGLQFQTGQEHEESAAVYSHEANHRVTVFSSDLPEGFSGFSIILHEAHALPAWTGNNGSLIVPNNDPNWSFYLSIAQHINYNSAEEWVYSIIERANIESQILAGVDANRTYTPPTADFPFYAMERLPASDEGHFMQRFARDNGKGGIFLISIFLTEEQWGGWYGETLLSALASFEVLTE